MDPNEFTIPDEDGCPVVIDRQFVAQQLATRAVALGNDPDPYLDDAAGRHYHDEGADDDAA